MSSQSGDGVGVWAQVQPRSGRSDSPAVVPVDESVVTGSVVTVGVSGSLGVSAPAESSARVKSGQRIHSSLSVGHATGLGGASGSKGRQVPSQSP